MKRAVVALLSFSFVVCASYWILPQVAAALSGGLDVIRITPSGDDISELRQIVFEFDRAVVPLGSMKREANEIPVEISPKVDCEWRWLNQTTLSCNLDERGALKEATHYEITVKPGLKALDNSVMGKAYRHEFTTLRPAISYSRVHLWKSPSHPQIQITTNQETTVEALEKALSIVSGDKTLSRVSVKEVVELDWQGRPRLSSMHKVFNVDPVSQLPSDTSLSLYVASGFNSKAGPIGSKKGSIVIGFDTFANFALVGIECRPVNSDDNAPALVLKHVTNIEQCDPTSRAYLLFNAPVSDADALKNLDITPSIPGFNIEGDTDNSAYTLFYALSRGHSRTDTYRVMLPALKPNQTYKIALKKSGDGFALRDVFERPLSAANEIAFATGHLRPHYFMPYRYAVLEQVGESDLAIDLTNMKSWQLEFSGVTTQGALPKQVYNQTPPEVIDKTVSMPMRVRERLKNLSGALYGQITTLPVVDKEAQQLFAEVTPFQVHVKVGHFNSMVWVTSLSTGKVVPGAKVTWYEGRFEKLQDASKKIATGVTDENGLAMMPGTSVFDPNVKHSYYHYANDAQSHYFVRVDKDEQMALLPLVDGFSTSTYRASNGAVYGWLQQRDRHNVAWGTTAQGVHRLGDKVQYKIYVREQNNETLKSPRRTGYALKVVDPMGKTVHEIPQVTLSAFGAVDGEFTVPRSGAVGWYQFHLISPAWDFEPMTVLVSDFTPVPFKVTQELNGTVFESGKIAKLTTRAQLHSGGAFSDAKVHVTAQVEVKAFSPTTPLTKGFAFASLSDEMSVREVMEASTTLNKAGELVNEFAVPQLPIYSGRLTFESSVQDDRGKSISAVSSADYVGVDRFVGLKTSESFAKSGTSVEVSYVVVDPKGDAQSGVPVSLVFERQQNTLARIKDVGNTYTTHVATNWITKNQCNGTSSSGVGTCTFVAKEAGLYRFTATIRDTKGRLHKTSSTLYVSGSEYVVWDEKNENFLDITPEKANAVVGETARFYLKNPYPGAKALITVERYGVIDRFVKTLDSSSAIIEIPVKPNYLPGFFLSVTIQSPRVKKAPKTGIDLGKPTFSMGYVQVPVVNRYKEIVVTAKAEQEVYKPRDKVRVKLHAQVKKGANNEPVELAVAVVDEAVFDLLTGGEQYYDPYRGFYNLGSIDLTNYSLLTRLITRQSVETKGANPGGGGGDGVDVQARSAFKMLSYWNPSVLTNAQGDAQVEFEAPDNLTGWRVLVMAVTPSDKAGLGSAKFKVNRQTEIRPVMPNQVVEGDSLSASFSVMNRTDKARDLRVSIVASGDVEASGYAATLRLAPYERQNVSLPIRVRALAGKRDVSAGTIRFVVRAGDNADTDSLEHTLPVEKGRSFETAVVYGNTIEGSASLDLAFPANIFTDVGSVDVGLSSSVISSVEGAFRYMRDYPYGCWEQKLTRGVMAQNYQRLKGYIPAEFSWPGSTTLAQETLDLANNFQAPSGGMAYFVASDTYADPYLSAYTALAFQWMRENGKSVPGMVEKRLHDYLQNFLKNDRAPKYYTEATRASVRATALYALASQGKATVSDLRRLQPLFKVMGLFGQSHFIQSALLVAGGEEMASEALREVMGQSTQSSGKFLFSDVASGEFDRILSSSLRSNCAALDALVSVAKKLGVSKVGDVPMKLVRSISQTRKSKEHWENTQENMFCMQALANYAQVYEADAPNLKVRALLGNKEFGNATLVGRTAKPLTLSRALEAGDAGKTTKLTLERKGQGRLYYSAALTTASREAGKVSVNAGMSLKREYSVWRDKKWVKQAAPVRLKRGELVRVDLTLSLPRPGNFVVVNDPIAGALEPVNAQLATSGSGGQVGADGFYHHELLNNVARFYSDYLPAGTYNLNYTAQVIGEGTFSAMPPLAQEMYDPDVLGKDVSVSFEVR